MKDLKCNQKKHFISLSELIIKLLALGKSLGTAESCTGGMISALLTSEPGSSDWFKGGIVAYSHTVKERVLGVPPETLKQFGAVSEETARAMATGARKLLAVECALAVTGIAGPGGGTPEKEVGTVCFGWDIEGIVTSSTCKFTGSRHEVRVLSVNQAIRGLLGRLPPLPD